MKQEFKIYKQPNMSTMKLITAKFTSMCNETGWTLKKGVLIYFDPSTKQAFHYDSPIAQKFRESADPAAGTIQANEEAYFDNFCQNNNI